MTAVLYDEVVTTGPAPRLRALPAPKPSAAAAPRPAPRRLHTAPHGDPLVAGAAWLLCVPLRQIYAALWRVGLLEVGA
ncbi:Rv1535 family protein [Mycobacterium sp.]|uniref:Rv1535 family protein n=1 Tax=Mycobacterium sp. TaxID=1785 RepID=UPI0031E2E6A1